MPQFEREQRAGAGERIFAEEIGTRAHALALCIAYDSPLVTLCDWPCNYRGEPGVEVLRRLPTVWKDSRVAKASKLGEYYGVMRQAFADNNENIVSTLESVKNKCEAKLDEYNKAFQALK